jgi:hypothetical protein
LIANYFITIVFCFFLMKNFKKEWYLQRKTHFFSLSETDGFDNWRKSSARGLSETVQTRLVAIQNPTNCSSARKVVCQFSISCGFGCRLHHAIYCLIMAYHTNRTLSFDPDQRNMVTVLWLHSYLKENSKLKLSSPY